jgi:hypothetical protein
MTEPGPNAAPRYRTQSRDTSVWADRLMFEHLRTLSPRESLELCMEACRAMDDMLVAGIRRDHPHADEAEVDLRLAVTKYGADVVESFTGRKLPVT